ncbi:MAG: substrate-binding domain-containing protein [Gammaproteobacteria bacterium]|nr:substrate-binding domain-containing protein [Gammaproteobacteria bacterium]
MKRKALPIVWSRFQIVKWLIIIVNFSCSSVALSIEVVVGGSGADLGTFKLLATAYEKINPDIKIKILPSLGSGGGIKAVKKDKIDICLISRKVKEKEESDDILFKHYAQTPLVFISNKNQAIKNITAEEVLQIYAGKKEKWSSGKTIKPVVRPENDSDIMVLKENMPGFSDIVKVIYKRRELPMALTDYDAINIVQEVDGSFGVSTLSIIKSENFDVNVFNLDKISPTFENIHSKQYNLYKDLYYCHKIKNKNRGVDEFLKFVFSNEGREILQQTGHAVLIN